jgi:beta-galactosidase
VTRGGPILMVQVENEYGFFGDDLDYMREMRQALLDAGFDVPLFQCNPTNAVAKTHIPRTVLGGELRHRSGVRLQGAGRGAAGAADVRRILFRLVRHLGRAAPPRRRRKCRGRHRRDAEGERLLQPLHGARRHHLRPVGRLRPSVPARHHSYDYDAPIGEAGWIGEKFEAYRKAMTPFLPSRRDPAGAAAAQSR